MRRTRLRGAPNTAPAGPIAVSIRLSNARLRVRATADFARRIHSRTRIGSERTREGAIGTTIRNGVPLSYLFSTSIRTYFIVVPDRFQSSDNYGRVIRFRLR